MVIAPWNTHLLAAKILHRDSFSIRQLLAGASIGGRMAASGNTYCP
jgi:hypothetical protein